MLDSIRHNVSRLGNFAGRDTREQFWPYAIALFTPTVVAVFAMIGKTSFDWVMSDSDPIADFRLFLIPYVIIILFSLLIGSAVARRLHDRNRSGAWGLLPLPFVTFSMLLAPEIFPDFLARSGPPAPAAFASVMVSGFGFYGSLGLLIVLLAGQGTRGDNPYGPEPRSEIEKPS